MTATMKNSPVHGTAVAVGERGFLFIGPSGAGKSGLALQMIAMGAVLISDDQVMLSVDGKQVQMRAPEPLRGLIEARGVGLINVTQRTEVALYSVIDLGAKISARMPQSQSVDVLGCKTPLINGADVPNLGSVLMIMGRATCDP